MKLKKKKKIVLKLDGANFRLWCHFLKNVIILSLFSNFLFMVSFSKSDTIYQILNFTTRWSFYYIY